jgi:hypothetical protein
VKARRWREEATVERLYSTYVIVLTPILVTETHTLLFTNANLFAMGGAAEDSSRIW